LVAQTELVARERLATVGKLAAGVAHEVGNPLSGVLGYLSLARDKTHEPNVREYLDLIEQEVQRISAIVRGLLDLGRPVKGTPAPVVLARLAETCVRLVQADPDLRTVQIEAEIDSGLVVRAESGPLSQVLLNLLINAAQAMDGKGIIRVAGRAEEGSVELVVEDEGPGLSADVQAHLFEPFFSTKGKGTGLGLAVSRHLVASLGGTLTATNREAGGARFSLKLPIA
jgi:signal transduction histidine kinase